MRRLTLVIVLITTFLSTVPAEALHNVERQVNASALAKPGLLIMDESGNRIVAENAPDSLRVPASVLKLITATVALEHLGGDLRYVTTIWSTKEKNEYLIRGSLDPFLTSSRAISEKFGHGFLMSLVSKANKSGASKIKLSYEGLYPTDVADLQSYLKKYKNVTATFQKVTSETASNIGESEIASITSVSLNKIISHTMLWSDNRVADRLAKASARKAGNSTSKSGLTGTYLDVLSNLGVNSEGLAIYDGSGLSKSNRVSARTIVELLARIRKDPKFNAIYDGLPIAGETGTLVKRFEKAPLAIGHIHAKTGWVNQSVTMAGYAESGDKEYVFAILADGITPTLKARNAARKAMDRLLETIVKGDH